MVYACAVTETLWVLKFVPSIKLLRNRFVLASSIRRPRGLSVNGSKSNGNTLDDTSCIVAEESK
jgi:hypothetical protein